jgi:hypothetical protein
MYSGFPKAIPSLRRYSKMEPMPLLTPLLWRRARVRGGGAAVPIGRRETDDVEAGNGWSKGGEGGRGVGGGGGV